MTTTTQPRQPADNTLWIVLAIGGFLWWQSNQGPSKPEAPTNDQLLAAVCEAFARHVEYDGTIAEPRLQYTADLGGAFNRFGRRTFLGKSAKASHGDWFKAIGARLATLDDAAPAGEAATLTPALRRKAVAIFKTEAEELRK